MVEVGRDIRIECDPDSNRNLLQFSVLRIRVRVFGDGGGNYSGSLRVVIRSNLNQAGRIRRQMIDRVEKGQNYSTDFHDIPAIYDGETGEYIAEILLNDVGYFEFKVRVESVRRRDPWVKWADGGNIGISVTPLEYGRNNSIYCAFIRQFVADKCRGDLRDEALEAAIKDLEDRGAYVIPPGGNFENFMDALPFIIDGLGMKIIHLLPINPVPTSYGRMGMYGSPYATTDYFGIDHTYAKFSRYKTIEDQFVDLTSTIHGLGAKVFLDMVINHAGWASTIHFTHPNWRMIDKDRKIVSPGAWGVVWGDLVELDYRHRDLWQYMANMFLVWCSRGIDGFRLDAGYMVPLEVWRYIICKVREEYPNTLFLLEGLGGPWAVTEELLTKGQMNWAYSELFQNYTREEIVNYLDYAGGVSSGKGVLVHYAETHDNDRLAKKGRVFASMRLHVCALTSFSGAWGFSNGVEWLATEKIDVHRNTGLNWSNEDNLVEEIACLNRILSENQAFWAQGNVAMADVGNDKVLAFVRWNNDRNNVVFCLLNLDVEASHNVRWLLDDDWAWSINREEALLEDLTDGSRRDYPDDNVLCEQLAPGECVLYRVGSTAKGAGAAVPKVPALFDVDYNKISLIYRILLSCFEPHEVGQIEQERLLRGVTDFRGFIVLVNTVTLSELLECDLAKAIENVTGDDIEKYSAVWTFSQGNKEFIISGDKWLVVKTDLPCTAYLQVADRKLTMESISAAGNHSAHLSFFPPQSENEQAVLTFNWKIHHGQKIQRELQQRRYHVLSVPSGRKESRSRKVYPLAIEKSQLHRPSKVLLTNGIGAMSQSMAIPGKCESKYDVLLAAACDRSNPVDRTSLVKTVRETVQVGQKFFDLDDSFLTTFTRYPHSVWEFVYDDGEHYLELERRLVMTPGENNLLLTYKLREANRAIKITTKVFLEYRSPHNQVSNSDIGHLEEYCNVLSSGNGVMFRPGENISVRIVCTHGDYIHQPSLEQDWYYPEDSQNGLDSHGDAFSPGVFTCHLSKGQNETIVFAVGNSKADKLVTSHKAQVSLSSHRKELVKKVPLAVAQKDPIVRMLVWALDQFIVETDSGYQVLSGYPWLPAMTAQSLRSVPGLLAAGRNEVVRDVILRVAASERDGLLEDFPHHTANRTGIEASLRLFLATWDYINATGDSDIYSSDCGNGRSLGGVLRGIFKALKRGDGKGPSLDDSSGLLYCPAGFTWMNSTGPQATPRCGYPVEIQPLWMKALWVFCEMDSSFKGEVSEITSLAMNKFLELFWSNRRGYLADILQAEGKIAAIGAIPDFSLRFNQLTAIDACLLSLEQARAVVDLIARRLLIPAGVRSLAEDQLEIPLHIRDEHGYPLIDPYKPYCGHCVGNETQRRIAYHNGTAWLWAYPRFIEARASAFGFSELAFKQALAFFEPIFTHLTQAGIGQLSEIKDGDYPHTPRGCYAHALTVAETLRVYMRLKYRTELQVNNRHKVERVGKVEKA